MAKDKQYRPRLSKKEWEILQHHRSKSNVLVIGDTHAPFTHTEYINFCEETANKMACGTIVHIGDLVDGHAWNYHEKNPRAYSAHAESELAQEEVDKWTNVFPEVKLCLGNHDLLVARKLQTIGLPPKFHKTFSEMWNLPKGWEVENSFEIDGVYYTHGTGISGENGAFNLAKQHRTSAVIGHIHHAGYVKYSTNFRGDMIFGLQTGCGIDIEAYAFEYGKDYPKKPTLGCGVVTDNGNIGMFIPMNL